MKIEVSNGEVVDKLTILQIKLEKISDSEKRLNIEKEFNLLNQSVKGIITPDNNLYQQLLEVNLELWKIEDRIRELEKEQDFGKEFIETARSVYFKNDLRSKIKKEINKTTGSDLFEEKSYEDY